MRNLIMVVLILSSSVTCFANDGQGGNGGPVDKKQINRGAGAGGNFAEGNGSTGAGGNIFERMCMGRDCRETFRT